MNDIINSFEKIQPSEQRLERILKKICEKPSTTNSNIIVLPRKRRTVYKYSISIVACLIVAIVGVIVKYSSDDLNTIPINDDKAYQIENASRNIIVGKSNSIDSTDIQSTTSHTVNGLNLTHDAMTLEELETFKHNKSLPATDDKNEFTIDYGEEYEQENDLFSKTYSTVNRHNSSGEILWSVTFKNFFLGSYIEGDGYIAICGHESVTSSEEPTNASIALLNTSDGEVIWRKKLSTQYKHEYVKGIVFDDDKLMVFAQGDRYTLIVMEFDLFGNGKLLAKNSLSFADSLKNTANIEKIIKSEQGYLALIRAVDGCPALAKIDASGNITEVLTYSSEGLEYNITDIIEFNNRLYISAYTMPKNENDDARRYDFRNILDDEIDISQDIEIINNTLNEKLRERVNSVLLICDVESGVPETFFSVSSSISSNFEVEKNGNLTWVVGDIAETLFSPYTSSFSFSVSCRQFSYIFNDENQLDNCYQTDGIIRFNR